MEVAMKRISRAPKWATGLGLVLGIPWLLISALVLPAGANPTPSSVAWVHVQAPNPAFCQQVQTLPCDQIVSHTEATGQLEFDLFFTARFLGDHYDGAEFGVTWPAAWGFVEAGICGGAQGSVSVYGNRAMALASWLPQCPELDSNAVLVARIVLDVTSHGRLEYNGQPLLVIWGCPPDENRAPLEWAEGAEAGVECAYCYDDCHFDYHCRPELTPETLDITIPQGDTDQFTIDVDAVGDPQPCVPAFSGTESWMAVGVEQINWYTFLLTLTVDTQGLGPGEYSGWVIGQSECRGCTRVNLTVIGSQGIPDEPADSAPPGVPASWGEIKNLYRR
jgi:hypothetical protein